MEQNTHPLIDMDAVNKDITYRTAEVAFPNYEYYLAQARQIAEYINNVELTEDTIKEAKTTLAAARKVADGLDRKRIDLKKQLLGNFNVFENQIREIQAVVSSAESELRGKVKELDDLQREQKKEKVAEIWDKRFPQYKLAKFTGSYEAFVKWLQPSFLNKNVSMKAVEQSMTDWLEERESDITACEGMGEEYLTEYLSCYHLPTAITAVQARQTRAAAIKEALSDAKNAEWVDDFDEEIDVDSEVAIFTISGKANIALAERLLTENGIKFHKQ